MSEVSKAVNTLLDAIEKDKVVCPACGCVVSASNTLCPQCNAVLPVTVKMQKKQKRTNLEFEFSTSPQFNKELWYKFYYNLFILGQSIAQMSNGVQVPEIGLQESERLVKTCLLANMIVKETASEEARASYKKIRDNYLIDLKEFKGWNSYWDQDSHSYSYQAEYINPISVGFITAADGTPFSARLGRNWAVVGWDLFYALMNAQELSIMYSSDISDLFCEQYINKFKHTRFASWCEDRSNRLLASAADTEWDHSPADFNAILRSPKRMKKFVSESTVGVINDYLLDGMRHFANRGGYSSTMSIINTLVVVKNYSKFTIEKLAGLEVTVSDHDIRVSASWLENNIGIPEVIVRS